MGKPFFMQKSKNHPENLALKEKLRALKSADIDTIAHAIAAEETQKTDCTTCGKCCQTLQPPFTQKDIKRIETEHTSIIELLVLDPSNQQYYLKQSPCHFFHDNKCNIYNERPQACADYPHLHQPHFKYRINTTMDNYAVCPIVYYTIERLKVALGVC